MYAVPNSDKGRNVERSFNKKTDFMAELFKNDIYFTISEFNHTSKTDTPETRVYKITRGL